MASPTQHTLIHIPELLREVFDFLPNVSNANNARVCKEWNGPALDALYHDIDSLDQLREALSASERGDFGYAPGPGIDSWRKFEERGRRVRRFRHASLCGSDYDWHILRKIEETRPPDHEIFPNLRTLVWESHPQFASLFMHERVTNFTFNFSERYFEPTLMTMRVFPQIARLMPNLTHLAIRVNTAMETTEKETVELLGRLPRLKSVAFGRNQFTAKVAEALSKLPDLATIKSVEEVHHETAVLQDTRNFDLVMDEGAFPALTSLAVNLQFPDAGHFLKACPTSSRLGTLSIRSDLIHSEKSFRHLITNLADECPNIETLSLASFAPVVEDIIAPTSTINIHTLRPLFRNKHITSLIIAHEYSLGLNDADLEEISLVWPTLHTLKLNPVPGYPDRSQLTLKALATLSRNCCKMRHLGLYIGHSKRIEFPTMRFEVLETLEFGLSSMKRDLDFIIFLRGILPSTPPHIRRETDIITWAFRELL